ncbi:MAG: hypothetical protein JSS20_02920 [Proteobacteria bacterium]|nr:hypothetical protein [Pseudomonadota bacterium]
MLRALGRLILVPVAMLIAAAVSAYVLVSLGLELTTHTLAGRADDADRVAVLLDLGLGFMSLAAAATVIPAVLLVIVGEVARIRSVLYYVLAGGIALAVVPLMVRWGGPSDQPMALAGNIWTVFATAGFAGGLVYWLIAGRTA